MAVVSDYQSFKDYLITFLWKSGDQILINNLDNLIRQGENMINRELREEHRHASITIVATQEDVDLPSDYYSLRQVADLDDKLGEFQYVSPAELVGRRDRSASSTWWPIYSIEVDKLMLCGPASVSEPKNLVVHYTRKIPKYEEDDASWLTEDNLDLLTYATLYNTAPFLREDERVQLWQGMYKDIIAIMNEMSAHDKQRGVYGAMPLSRNASGRTRKGVRRQAAFKLETRP